MSREILRRNSRVILCVSLRDNNSSLMLVRLKRHRSPEIYLTMQGGTACLAVENIKNSRHRRTLPPSLSQCFERSVVSRKKKKKISPKKRKTKQWRRNETVRGWSMFRVSFAELWFRVLFVENELRGVDGSRPQDESDPRNQFSVFACRESRQKREPRDKCSRLTNLLSLRVHPCSPPMEKLKVYRIRTVHGVS